MSSEVLHFAEDDRPSQRTLLPMAVYGLALDSLVITCVDLAFLWGSELLLGKRTTYPRQGWWLIGGRMFAGESPVQAAQRKAEQEASLILSPERFLFVAAYSTCFSMRSQPPQENGVHSVNLTYQVRVTSKEREQLQLVESEYEQWQWVERSRIPDLFDSTDRIDRALLKIVEDLEVLER